MLGKSGIIAPQEKSKSKESKHIHKFEYNNSVLKQDFGSPKRNQTPERPFLAQNSHGNRNNASDLND
jgi:hypothetical protein